MRPDAQLVGVRAIVEPYNRTHDLYQRYYRESLAAYCSEQGIAFHETGSRFPGLLRALRRVRDSASFKKVTPQPLASRVVDGLAHLLGGRRAREHAVGAYMLETADGPVKVCIDAQDYAAIEKLDLLEWCDVYFKTNCWPDRAYPDKVLPLANLNPYVLNRRAQLADMRDSEKEWDLFAFFRVWGGSNEVEGVEHNLALFETLARVNCRKKLLAYLVAGDVRAAAARLEKAGVPWTTKWMPLPELWRIAARSKLNIVRHGMHQCIPWRMTDMLAMGGCPVLDYPATTTWHVPLQENIHYLNLNVPYQPSRTADFKPDEVVDRVEGWLASKDLIPAINHNAGRYFDEHLAPEKIGQYILKTSNRPGIAWPKTDLRCKETPQRTTISAAAKPGTLSVS